MRAIRQHQFGGPEVLVVEDVPDLAPGPGQVRIAVAAAGVHVLDLSIRAGESGGPFPLPDLPMTPGREVAGVVDAVGPDIDASWLGRSVVAHLGQASGGYATQALAPVGALIPLPDHVDPAEAVAMVGTGRTTLGVLAEAQLTAADVVLVTAAAGGIGSLLVQAARHAGAVTIGAAGGAAKVALVESLGADLAVDYTDPAWADQVRERGVTAVLESVGGAIGRQAFDLVRPGGRIVMVGYSSGEMIDFAAADVFAHGVTVTAADVRPPRWHPGAGRAGRRRSRRRRVAAAGHLLPARRCRSSARGAGHAAHDRQGRPRPLRRRLRPPSRCGPRRARFRHRRRCR